MGEKKTGVRYPGRLFSIQFQLNVVASRPVSSSGQEEEAGAAAAAPDALAAAAAQTAAAVGSAADSTDAPPVDSVAAVLPAEPVPDDSDRDDCSSPADLSPDDCSVGPTADGRYALAALLAGCSAATDSNPDDCSAAPDRSERDDSVARDLQPAD